MMQQLGNKIVITFLFSCYGFIFYMYIVADSLSKKGFVDLFSLINFLI